MSSIKPTSVAVIASLIAVLALSSCANTIRGVGRDVGSSKDAVEDAAN